MGQKQVICEWECPACKRISETKHPVDALVKEIEAKRPMICGCGALKPEFKFHSVKS